MQECLGIDITDKLIRYAKVKKDNNTFVVESYGIKFYNNVTETIDQIITETNSENIPISSNLSNEKYYYFNIFNLTNKTYASKAIKTEFESFCTENHLNSSVYEGKYVYTRNIDNPDQSKVIYVYDSQNDISERQMFFDKRKLEILTPLATTLSNIINAEKNKNSMIINIEEKTTVTTIVNQAIYSVDTLEEGMGEILDNINEKENSYSKSYEVCKNTTIYTMETDYSSMEENEYLKYIVPVLYKITEKLHVLKDLYKRIDNIYITGMGAVINNIDLYFKEYFKDSKVEILKPFFLEQQMNMNVNIKDYVEVNSAIALALQGLGNGIKSLNFLGKDWKESLKSLLSSDLRSLKDKRTSKGPKTKTSFKPNINFKTDMRGKFDWTEKLLLRNIITVFVIIIVYSIGSNFLVKQIDNKIAEADEVRNYISGELSKVNSDDNKITGRTIDYQRYTSNLNNISSVIMERNSRKNQITTLLNKIVYSIPQLVDLVSIDNTEITDGENIKQHIVLSVKSVKYEQLAYFKAKLKNANVLEDIASTEGQKSGNEIMISIEGNLRTY